MYRPLDIKSSLAWIWTNARGVRSRVSLSCLCGLVRVALGLVAVWLSKLLVDAATTGGSGQRIVWLAVILASVMLVELALMLVVHYIGNTTETRMRCAMRSRLYSHVLRSPRGLQPRSMHTGDIVSRLVEDVKSVSDIICSKMPDICVTAFQLVAATIFLCALSWQLALCGLCIMPFFLLLSRSYIKRTREITADVRAADSRIQSGMQEGLQHHVVVQTLECEPRISRLNDIEQRSLYGHVVRRTKVGVFSRAMIRLGFIACYLTAFLWSVWHLHLGVITFGTMTAFLQLMARVQTPMYNLSQHVPSFVNSLASVDRLAELERWPVEDKGRCVELKRPVGIRVQGVSYAYPAVDHSDSRDVLHDFSHDFAPGSKTVVMGETGVGKSTLVRLMLALLTPREGTVTLYDSTREVPVSAATRCNMVYVPQGNSLLDCTVRENLLLGNPDATEAEMVDALHTACADFALDLPHGLDTRCGELGAQLSEGQAQRIAIARALLHGGNILLLDEFNSALDRHTAATLMQRLAERYADHTIVFISHRREVMEYCDNVLELSQ